MREVPWEYKLANDQIQLFLIFSHLTTPDGVSLKGILSLALASPGQQSSLCPAHPGQCQAVHLVPDRQAHLWALIMTPPCGSQWLLAVTSVFPFTVLCLLSPSSFVQISPS